MLASRNEIQHSATGAIIFQGWKKKKTLSPKQTVYYSQNNDILAQAVSPRMLINDADLNWNWSTKRTPRACTPREICQREQVSARVRKEKKKKRKTHEVAGRSANPIITLKPALADNVREREVHFRLHSSPRLELGRLGVPLGSVASRRGGGGSLSRDDTRLRRK